MTAFRQNFEMYNGDTKDLVVTVTSAGSVKDLSGATARWQLAQGPGGPALVFKQTGAGIALTDPLGGQLTIRLAPADTQGLSGHFYHECEVIDAQGNVATVMTGRILIHSTLIQ